MVIVCTSLTPTLVAVSWETVTDPVDWAGLDTSRPLIFVFSSAPINSIVKP